MNAQNQSLLLGLVAATYAGVAVTAAIAFAWWWLASDAQPAGLVLLGCIVWIASGNAWSAWEEYRSKVSSAGKTPHLTEGA